MFSIKTTFTLGIFATVALASPTQRAKRAPAAITHAVCSDATYSNYQIQAVVKAGAELVSDGTFVGQAYGNHFPLPWFNVDNLAITVPGSYWQFPILPDGTVFDGNVLPGNDYVIFNSESQVAAVIEATPLSTQAGYALCGKA